MSIRTLTTVGVARNRRQPTKSDSGEVLEDQQANTEAASLPQLLVKQVPTGMVAAYTAFTAAVVELIDEPTADVPDPDLLIGFRWGGFALLVIGSMAMLYVTYRTAAGPKARQPVAEVLGVGIAATGWGLVIPESPLLAQSTGDSGVALVLLISFAAVVGNLVVAKRLQTPQNE